MDDPVEALLETLDLETEALKNGKLADLEPLAARKEAALATVDFASLEMDKVVAKAARNAVLLKAAMSGVASARERLEQYAHQSPQLQTYSADGRRQNVSLARPTVERRR